MYKFSRYGGYDVSMAGDARFSPFRTVVHGKSIHNHLLDAEQLDYKEKFKLFEMLFEDWADEHPELIEELMERCKETNYTISAQFDATNFSQGYVLCNIMNKRIMNDMFE